MRISITEANGQLSELVRRAEAGDEILLTRYGHAAVKLVPIRSPPSQQDRLALLTAIRKSGAEKAVAGPAAARSQDFLYDDQGLTR